MEYGASLGYFLCQEDTDLILSLPVSIARRRDRKIWHYSLMSDLSVKSAYCLELERSLRDNQRQTGESSHVNGLLHIWKKLWGLIVHPKVRFFCVEVFK